MSNYGGLELRGLKETSVWDYENGYHWFSHPSRIAKLLAHYELYKKIIDIPGHVFELGVYKGTSLIRLATFRELLENSSSRKIVGFDAFGKFPTEKISSKYDLKFVADFEHTGGDGLELHEVSRLLTEKGFENVELVEGNVFDTLPKYISDNPECRLALLHLDLDLREPTELALDLLFDRVVIGGLVIFDDYGAVAGETEAVDSFLRGRSLTLQKLPFYSVPAFIKKLV